MSGHLWKKGQSGNPAGRPKGAYQLRDIRQYCKEHSKEAVEALIEVMNSKTAPPSSRVVAANSLLDRGWGKPTMEITATVTSYDNMSEAELVGYITGQVIEGEVIQALIDAEQANDEILDEEAEDDDTDDTAPKG